ncbi:type II toxin-antitoxin system VapC family toxin [Aurantimonas sp. 22II-16-19i]|uniref:type II toxin-antitoxin system VapC family toxin n=1 Tax=Aurantimonas sp. 22II-16-19i TaxID=1317114 RepID=UPI0009F7CE06|nr:type II toxin-antitoxin system VapC family toxin [Aurantimonas sp. 22II-16-19i]ORE97203.1 PilT protein, N-terminal [Aurantimonas sp. 22II-16-19i]
MISAARKPWTLDERVAQTIGSLPLQTAYVSVITLMELEIGVISMERRDRQQGADLRQWLRSRRAELADSQILPVTELVALRCATLHVPDRRPRNDSLIAATALVHGLTLVTRNVADFDTIDGLRILNLWA